MNEITDNNYDIERELGNVNQDRTGIDDSEYPVLLPVAVVEVYTEDDTTRSALASIAHDWRFGRVKLTASEGDASSAIKDYSLRPSPDLLIIQTETIDDVFVEQLEQLSEVCRDDTYAIVIGPVNDVYLYRKLISMGVSDYLVRPVDAGTLANIIAKSLIERMGVADSELIAVIGAKGGVGTSTVAQMLSNGITKRFSQKTMLLDMAGGWSINPIRYGYSPTTNLPEVLKIVSHNDEEDYLSRVIISPIDKLDMLSTGGDVLLDHDPSPQETEDLINVFMEKYPAVVVDLSGAPTSVSKVICSRASSVVIVTTPIISSVSVAETLFSEIKAIRGGSTGNIHMIMNMEGISPQAEVSKKDMNSAIGCDCAESIAFNPSLFINSEENGIKFFDNKNVLSYSVKLALMFKDKFEKNFEEQKENEQSKNSVVAKLLDILTKNGK